MFLLLLFFFDQNVFVIDLFLQHSASNILTHGTTKNAT